MMVSALMYFVAVNHPAMWGGHLTVIQSSFFLGWWKNVKVDAIIIVANRVDVFFCLISAIDIQGDGDGHAIIIVKIMIFRSFKSIVDCDIWK